MELYHIDSPAEHLLRQKADREKIPLGGAIELLPLCNMDCKMCYVRKSKAEMDAEGTMLTCDQWLHIADQALDMGMLYLLLTGGEPLMYPDFKRLYRELTCKGIILQVNTNGTLIDEEYADFFSTYGCRRLNITLYGKDDDTYARLCGNPHGFTQVMNACHLLKERNVPFRLTCSVTPDNVDDLPALYAIAAELGAVLQPASYMFPGSRRGICAEDQCRLRPEDAAAFALDNYRYAHPETDLKAACHQTLSKSLHPPKLQHGKGFSCHAAQSGFWLNWKGEMTPCGMFDTPRIQLTKHSFKECWEYIVAAAAELPACQKCVDCKLQNLCQVCPAACYAEAGSTDGWPEYVCRMTHETVRLMSNIINSKGEPSNGS